MSNLNTSGIRPIEYRVLVRLDPIEEKSKGGIIIPTDTRDMKKESQERATVIAAGRLAFDGWHDEDIPEPGDRVLIARYEGRTFKGADGLEYRAINDKDIIAFLEKEAASG